MSLGFEAAADKQKRLSPLRNAMLGNTPVVTATSAEDEAAQLLQAAAEIEHALLIQYLYAAISLRDATVRKTLFNIAIQEMSHLLAVQNLLLFLGKLPYVERQDVSPNPDLDPFPFELKGLRHKETLERFVLAEMPVLEALSPGDRAIVAEIRQRLDPDAKFHRVGVLYGRIYWLFQTSSAPEGEWKDVSNMADIGELPQWHIGTFDGAATFGTRQASRDEKGLRADGDGREIWWQDKNRGGAFATIDSRPTALRLIYDIAVQGEGLATADEHSHFHLFFEALKNYGDIDPGDFNAVPDNPATSAGPGRVEVTDPAARALCDLLNNRYRIMLVCLTIALNCERTPPDDNARRQKRAFWAFFEMRFCIPMISDEIVGRPCVAGGDADALCAGPTFELGDVDLTGDMKALETENRNLHVRARECIAAVKQLGIGSDFVDRIEATDRERYPDI